MVRSLGEEISKNRLACENIIKHFKEVAENAQ